MGKAWQAIIAVGLVGAFFSTVGFIGYLLYGPGVTITIPDFFGAREATTTEEAIAVAGADVGGSIAIKYAALHEEVPMVFILSPGMNFRNVQTVSAIRAYKDRPILMVVGADDRRSSTETVLPGDPNGSGLAGLMFIRTPECSGPR